MTDKEKAEKGLRHLEDIVLAKRKAMLTLLTEIKAINMAIGLIRGELEADGLPLDITTPDDSDEC